MNYSWYTNSKSRESPDAIHQIFAFGSLSDIQLLKKTLGVDKLKKLFLDRNSQVGFHNPMIRAKDRKVSHAQRYARSLA